MARSLTEKQVLALKGDRKLNPALIDAALDALRSLYLGFAYPYSMAPKIKSNALIPINKLLLDPELANKLSDSVGDINIGVLQSMIEDAATGANRVAEVSNKIADMQNRLVDIAFPQVPLPGKLNLPISPIPRSKMPKIPPAFSGKFLDGATHLFFMDSVAEQERAREKAERVRIIGADIDPDNYVEMIKHAARIYGESQWLAEKLVPGPQAIPLTYAKLVDSEKFKAFQVDLNKQIEADYKDLQGSATFKQYVKAWPVAGDSIVAAFTGVPVATAYIPLREIATIGLIAGRDPAVRKIAMGIANNIAGHKEDPDATWHTLFNEMNRTITDSVKSGAFKDARLMPEIAAQFALTSPVTWDALGIKNPSVNYVAEGMAGVQWIKENVRQRLERGVFKQTLDFLTDKDILGFEQMNKKVGGWLETQLGPKYGKELVGKIKGDISAKLEGLYMNTKGRTDQATAWREKVMGIVRSRFAVLTPEEQQAAILKVQSGRAIEGGFFDGFQHASAEVKNVWNNELVDDTVSYIQNSMKRVRMFDPTLPDDPYYFPAQNIFAKDGAHLAQLYGARGYMKQRTVNEVVIPTAETLNQNVVNFADRLAGPQFLSFVTDKAKSARAVASATMDTVAGAIAEPEKYIDDIAQMFTQVANPNGGKKVASQIFNQTWSEFQNTVFLTSRAGDWIKRNILDDMVRGSMNVYDNFKSGRIPSRSDLVEAFNKQMPMELYDGMFSRILMDDADPYSLAHASMMHKGFNESVYAIAEGAQEKALKYTAAFAFAAEKAAHVLKTGEKVLTPEVEQMITGRAVEQARDYMLANQVNSAFSSNLATKLILSYPGFFMRSTAFVAKELGRSPELFTAGAALSNQLREVNADQPEWDKQRVIAFGRSFSDISSLSMWPIMRAIGMADSDVVRTDPDSQFQTNADMLKKLPPDEQKNVLANKNNAGLVRFVSRSGLRAIGSYVESFRDLNVMPIGAGADALMKYAGMIQKRTPYWMIGSQQLNQFGQAIGWKSLSPEGHLNPTVAAWEKNQFDTNVMLRMVQMFNQDEVHNIFKKRKDDEKKLTPDQQARRKEMVQAATDSYRNEQMKDLLFNRYFGFGRKFDADIQNFNNVVAQYSFAQNFITPDPQDIEDIKQKTGLKNDDEAEFLWKTSQVFAASREKKIMPFRKKLLREFPAIPEIRALLSQRSDLKRQLGMIDTEATLESFPESLKGKAKEAQRVYNAFLKLNEGRYVLDKNGNEVYKFDGNRKVGDILGQWTFTSDPEKKEAMLQDPAVESVVKQLDPDNYAHFKMRRSKNWVVPVPQTIEEDHRADKTFDFGELLKRAIFNPNGAPQDIFDAFLQGKPDLVKQMDDTFKEFGTKALDAIEKGGEFIMRPFVSIAGAEEFQPSLGRELERASDPDSEEGREALEKVFDFMDKFDKLPANTKAVPTPDDERRATEVFRNEILDGDPSVRAAFKKNFPKIWKQRAYELDKDGNPINKIVGASDSPDVIDYENRLNRALVDPYSTQQTYKDLINQGKKLLYGRPMIDRMKNNGEMRGLIDIIQYQADGNIYRLGVQRNPAFNLNTEEGKAAQKLYKEFSFSPPKETLMQFKQRLYDNAREVPQETFDKYTLFLRRQGYTEMPELLSEIRAGSNKTIPLDRNTQRRIDDLREQMPYIEDDPLALKQELSKDPDLTATILHYEPRLYKTLQSKLFGPYDKGWKSYVQGSSYSPEAISYFRRLAPQTYSRLYWKDPDFRARMDQLGYPQPAPSAETAITRSWTDANGVAHTEMIPDVLTPPEPINPDPVPRGTFSSLPALLNYTAQNARDEVFRINAFKQSMRKQGESDEALNARFADEFPSDQTFLNTPNTTRIFQRFPAIIAQGFREGQLGPDDVIQNLSGINRFAVTEGFISPEQHQRFENFLNTSTNVFGATHFGFQIGSFLDEAFNIPRIPVSSAALDFALAGQPVSTIPRPISTTEATSLLAINPVRAHYQAQLPAFNNIPEAPIPSGDSVTEGVAAGAGAAAPAASLAGLPAVGAVFAVIAGGFALSNVFKSGRQRRRMKDEANRAAAERQRQIDLARAQQAAESAAASNRAVSGENFRILQQAESARVQDFRRRLQQVVNEGVSFASLAQQPREFVNSFVNQFEPQVISFTNRPQIDSRVGLIRNIQSRLPKARY